MPDGQLGGTIWTKPVVDAARNSVFVTTGNRAYDSTGDSQVHAESLVAVDATTLAIKGYWSLPVADPTPDDWGTAPTLFTDAFGRALVSAANKNGVLYTFLRDNVSAGPVWFRRLAEPAVAFDAGAGAVYSNGYFDGQRLFYAGGKTTVDGQAVKGSIRALNPATGAVIWEQPLPIKTYGALTGANGMVVVPSERGLRVFNAITGELLYANDIGLYAAAAIANGRLFIGDTKGVIRAFTFPSSPGAAAASRAAAGVALARGCQPAAGLSATLTHLNGPIRVTRLARAGAAPVTVALHAGDDCSGRPLMRATLRGGTNLVLRIPRALRARARVSLASSRAVRLKLALGAGKRK